MLTRRIEEASLNSWPARQQFLLDGWVMRASGGYTKRANSVTPVYPSSLPPQDKIAACERFYTEQQQRSVFRLPSFVEETQALDALLAQRAYQPLDLTHVLHQKITAQPAYLALRAVQREDWLRIFCQLSQVSFERHLLHLEILKRIAFEPLYAVLYQGETPVACGVGVRENELFGLFDIVTSLEHRRKGYGTQLITGMLDWARQQGATDAYLQVLNVNQAARELYAKLGFQELYHYWYRVQPQ